MRNIILAAIEKGLPILKGETKAALLEHVLAQAVQAPIQPKVAPPKAGPMITRPMAPKQPPTGIHQMDHGMPISEWSDQSEQYVRNSVKQMLSNFFNSNGITDRSATAQDVQKFLGAVDEALSGMFQRLSSEDQAKLDTVHKNYNIERNLREELKRLRPNKKEMPLEEGVGLEERGPNFAAAKDGIVKIQSMMVDLANEADKAGMEEKADAITAGLRDIGIIKFAQFESAQPYWMLNSRAFEKAVKERKKQNKPDDFTAEPAEDGEGWHEAWWKTLEEYQDALLGEHEDFLKKHASKEHASNRSADEFMLIKIADRMGEGKSPGVAFYEAMDDLVSGEYIFDVMARANAVADEIHAEASGAGNQVLAEKAKSVSAGIADWLGNWVGKMVSPVSKGLDWAGDQAGEFGYGLQRGFNGQLMEQAARIRDLGTNVWSLIRALKQGNRFTPQQFAAELSETLPAIDRFSSLARKAGAQGLPKPGAILAWINANKTIGQAQGEAFGNVWQTIWNLSEPERAAALQKTLNKTKNKTRPTQPGAMPKFNSPSEIQSVMKSIRENLSLLKDENDRRKAFKMLMSLRNRLESMKANFNRVASVKTSATRDEISQWLMSVLGDQSYEFANAVGTGFESALARPTKETPTAPISDETKTPVPVSTEDNLELKPIQQKLPVPQPVASLDDLELQPINKGNEDRRMWRLPKSEEKVETAPVSAPVSTPALIPESVVQPVAAPAVPEALPNVQKVSPRAKKPNLGRGAVPKS